jgi:hypothetical protein
MITLTVPKPKGKFNYDYKMFNQTGTLIYQYRSNWCMTKHRLLGQKGEILLESRSSLALFRWPVSHQILSDGKVIFTLTPQFKNNGVETSLRMIGHTETKNFSIFEDQNMVLRVTNYRLKGEICQIEVEETKTDFLIMLMMSLIVMYFEPPIYW